MHIVLRAPESLMHFEARAIEDCLKKISRENQTRVYEFSTHNNHLHMLLKTMTRGGFKRLLRMFAARVALIFTKAVKGRKLAESFWALLAFSRIVEHKAFPAIRDYVIRNREEA